MVTKRKSIRTGKLTLERMTLRTLSADGLAQVQGGSNVVCNISKFICTGPPGSVITSTVPGTSPVSMPAIGCGMPTLNPTVVILPPDVATVVAGTGKG